MKPFSNRLKLALPIALASIALVLGAAACGDDDDDPTPTPGASPTTPVPADPTTPGSPATPTPTIPSGPVGDDDLDPIARAIADGDIDALIGRVSFFEIACVEKVQGAGGPPQCPAGVPDGSILKVIAMSDCEGYYVAESALEESLATMLGRGFTLYAAFEQTDTGSPVFPTGAKVLLYEEESTGFGRMVNVNEDGELVSITSVCGATPAQIVENRNIASFILAPEA